MAFRLSSLFATALIGCLLTAPAASGEGVDVHHQKRLAAFSDAPETPLIAPPGACPDQTRLDAPVEVQEAAMRCMTDFARRRAGLGGLDGADGLDWSARAKSGDILRCDSFSHFACGRPFSFWIREASYMTNPCWRVGENIAWGQGGFATVRSIFLAWMRSPGHRENILGEFDELGLGLRVGTLGKRTDASVWTQHFGSHCGEDPA